MLDQDIILIKKAFWSKGRDVTNSGSCHLRQKVKGSYESYLLLRLPWAPSLSSIGNDQSILAITEGIQGIVKQ